MKLLQSLHQLTLLAATTMTIAACSLMQDDLEECPQGLRVEFVYDYNTVRGDLFAEHVGGVMLFIYDTEGRLVTTRTVDNTDALRPLANPGYRMVIEDLPEGTYRLVALATQRPASELLNSDGIRYRWAIPAVGDDLHSLAVNLATKSTRADFDTLHYAQQLDTLWHGSLDRPSNDKNTTHYDRTDGRSYDERRNDRIALGATVTIKSQEVTNCTVYFIRDTKRLHISLHQIDPDEQDDCDIDDYDIRLYDNNTSLLYNNEVAGLTDEDLANGGLPKGQPVVYEPFARWNTWYSSETDSETSMMPPSASATDVQETAHAEIDFNRLILRPAKQDPARLVIISRKTGDTVADINLASILADSRGWFEMGSYKPQEFLDRSYDYTLHFFLQKGSWRYIELHIHTLPWVKRIQRIDIN